MKLDAHWKLAPLCTKINNIDLHANHANACISAAHPRDVGHEELGRFVASMATEAGCIAHHNPHTHLVLGGGLSRDEVAQRFPNTFTKATDDHFDKVQKQIRLATHGPLASRQRALNEAESLLRAAPDGHGLEIDVHIIGPDGQERWLDVTMFHQTCGAYSPMLVAWHEDYLKKEIEAFSKGLALPPCTDPTPAMQKAMDKKHRKYAPMLHWAHVLRLKQRSNKKLPLFVAGAMSHGGKMAPEFFLLVEFLTAYRRRAAMKNGALYDGIPPARVAADIRTRFKAGIQTIVARTAGRIMASTGIPGSFSGQGGPRRRVT